MGDITQNIGTVQEKQGCALANHCPPLRLLQATEQRDFSIGTFKSIIGVLLLLLSCHTCEMERVLKMVTKLREPLVMKFETHVPSQISQLSPY